MIFSKQTLFRFDYYPKYNQLEIMFVFVLAVLFIFSILHTISVNIDDKSNKKEVIPEIVTLEKLLERYGNPIENIKFQGYYNFKPKFQSERLFIENGGLDYCNQRVVWEKNDRYTIFYLMNNRVFRKFKR